MARKRRSTAPIVADLLFVHRDQGRAAGSPNFACILRGHDLAGDDFSSLASSSRGAQRDLARC